MINVAYQSLLPSLWSTSSWSSEKPCNNCSPERHLASLLSLQFQAQNDTRRAAAGPGPCAPVRGWLTWLYICGTMSWFPAANSLLEFLCLIIQKARSLKSWNNLISNPHYHYQKNCSWFKEKKLSQSCRPSKKLTVIIHYTASQLYTSSAQGFCPSWDDVACPLARFGRISRGVPRAVFSFTITRYLVWMKRK